jgi:hypothetical protein
MEAAVAALATIVGAAIIIGGFYLWDRWTHSNTRVELGVAAHVFSRKARAQFHCLTCSTYW